jgi:hypothetical protein
MIKPNVAKMLTTAFRSLSRSFAEMGRDHNQFPRMKKDKDISARNRCRPRLIIALIINGAATINATIVSAGQ